MKMRESVDDLDFLVQRHSYYTEAGQRVKQRGFYPTIKRISDIFISALGILLALPIIIVVSLLIKLTDPKGTVLFKQTRLGKDGVPFTIYKFRSMVHNAEELKQKLMEQNEVSGAMFKIKNDPRVTKVGRFIRKTSVDEIPQLWNVLIGDMSMVGPRPPLVEEVALYTPYQKQRLSGKPGCTGYWQVSGRSNLGFEEMVELDLAYIRKQSILFDFVIMAKTVWMVLARKDAY